MCGAPPAPFMVLDHDHQRLRQRLRAPVRASIDAVQALERKTQPVGERGSVARNPESANRPMKGPGGGAWPWALLRLGPLAGIGGALGLRLGETVFGVCL